MTAYDGPCSLCDEPNESVIWHDGSRKKVLARFCYEHRRKFTKMNRKAKGALLHRLATLGKVAQPRGKR
jgi:hypothetical protein